MLLPLRRQHQLQINQTVKLTGLARHESIPVVQRYVENLNGGDPESPSPSITTHPLNPPDASLMALSSLLGGRGGGGTGDHGKRHEVRFAAHLQLPALSGAHLFRPSDLLFHCLRKDSLQNQSASLPKPINLFFFFFCKPKPSSDFFKTRPVG